ncbi:hypothetical protein Fcan01_28017 [Folsomia candida]|uniref:Uncharacterized protein n=2 Tax=Folsomia candida TaxID=158441 RepID=A0A226CW84_FOLCA|nr:hypothetical protein Fcan01_28017 [Folsomia candida]
MFEIKNFAKFLLITSALSQFRPVSGALVAKLCNATVPVMTVFAGVSYDGDDSIFHFGGLNVFPTEMDPELAMNAIWRYSISADAFDLVTRLPIGMLYPSIINSGDGTYHILGGAVDEFLPQYSVFKFSVENRTVTEVAQLPNIGQYMGAFKRDEETVFLLRRDISAAICKFNLSSYETVWCTPMGEEGQIRFQSTSILLDDVDRLAYIALFDNTENQTVLRYDAVREEGTLINFGAKNFTGYATSPTDSLRRYGYAMGSYNSVSSLLRFDFRTQNVEYFPFEISLPGVSSYGMGWSVFIPKLNGIYLFGGYLQSSFRKEVWFVDLVESEAGFRNRTIIP